MDYHLNAKVKTDMDQDNEEPKEVPELFYVSDLTKQDYLDLGIPVKLAKGIAQKQEQMRFNNV